LHINMTSLLNSFIITITVAVTVIHIVIHRIMVERLPSGLLIHHHHSDGAENHHGVLLSTYINHWVHGLYLPEHLSDRAPHNLYISALNSHLTTSDTHIQHGIPCKGLLFFSHRISLFVISHYT